MFEMQINHRIISNIVRMKLLVILGFNLSSFDTARANQAIEQHSKFDFFKIVLLINQRTLIKAVSFHLIFIVSFK